jgi:diaminopimelate decarboxylase
MTAPPTSSVAAAADAELRAGCEGVAPLSARLEPWQVELCARPELVSAWMDEHGSPVNLLDPSPMGRNAAGLTGAAARVGVDLGIYFARKANKALAFVDEARRLGLGIDLASERELAQVLDRGVPGGALVMTAAVKPAALLQLCVASGTTVVIDNTDELRRLERIAQAAGRPAAVALRLAPDLGHDRAQTRFGFGLDEAIAVGDAIARADAGSTLAIAGVHFHLNGYDAGDRVTALAEALALVDALRLLGHEPGFVDIGGGIPISHLDSAEQWERFWSEHREGLLGRREPLTFEGHGLGLIAHDGELLGSPATYPFHQRPIHGAWLEQVLAGQVTSAGRSRSVAEALRERGLELRCEPGRALLDGCGMTAARVSHRKQRRDGTWLIGLEMNRTQCRSTSEDFLVDPLLLRPAGVEAERTAAEQRDGGERGAAAERSDIGDAPTRAIEGYLVGAYCIELELLTWRRLRFPRGVAVGDIVVFPNTAGYLMHILESSSHQIPLARNLVVGSDGGAALDPIDAL